MKDKNSIETEIGFADGEIISYVKDNQKLTVFIKAWNNVIIKVIFNDVIAFLDKGAGDISDFCQFNSDSTLLLEALNRNYDTIPYNHGYKIFQFLDNDDTPVIEIVCGDVILPNSNSK